MLLFLVMVFFSGCSKKVRVPIRDILYSDNSLQYGFGAYGYLVFTARHSNETLPRYLFVCDAYGRNFESIREYGDMDKRSLMVTYWLLEGHPLPNDNEASCADLIDRYDYATAIKIASDIGKLESLGPILVAWKDPYSKGVIDSQSLIFDMSGFQDEDIDRGFRIWRDRIVRDPKLWDRGFLLVKAREAFRSLIQQYGEIIVEVVQGS